MSVLIIDTCVNRPVMLIVLLHEYKVEQYDVE